MTYRFTDPDGDALHIEPTRRHGRPAISLRNLRVDIEGTSVAVHVPVDQVEELIAGIRDTARQAAAPPAGPVTAAGLPVDGDVNPRSMATVQDVAEDPR
ncbi:hypothetical protein ABZ890_12045 [Streptomyces sp. NPDC046984]|uniref:hypothetical protein n=1 Tax=Streptomyces sp. NPDC046984 TaxID=3155138 RepID=UPI0033FF928D